MSAARLLLAFCMVFTYPMECFVTRHCLLSIVHRIMSDREKAKEKLLQSGVGGAGMGAGSSGVNSFGDIEEQNPMMKGAYSLRKNTNNTSINVTGQRYIQDGTDPRSRHKDGCAYDSGDERPGGGTRRDSLEILLSASEDVGDDRKEREEKEREREGGGPSVIYFNAEDDLEGRERRCDEDVMRNDRGKGKDRQKGREREKKRSTGVRSGDSKSVRSGNSKSNSNNSKHSTTSSTGSREGSRRNSPETLFTVCGTRDEGNDSDNDDVTSNDSLSSPCSVSTARTACSAVNEKSEIEEETKSSVLNDGRRNENRMKNENVSRNEKSREGSRSANPMQNGEKVLHNDESHKDTVFINVDNGFNNQVSVNKSDIQNNINGSGNSNDDFDYDVLHPVSLTTTSTQDGIEKEKESNHRFYSRTCPCSSSCPCGVSNPFSDRQNTARVAVTLLLWGSSVAIALMFRDLGMVLALTGVCVCV